MREKEKEGEGRASLQIATPHCGVTPACYDTAPASPEWCPRVVLLSFVLLRAPPPPASYVAPLLAVNRLRAAGGALHACKRAFTPITRLFRRVSGPEFGPFGEL